MEETSNIMEYHLNNGIVLTPNQVRYGEKIHFEEITAFIIQ